MRNITFSADAALIDAARAHARGEGTTLNEQFRRWLTEYVQRGQQAERAMAVIERIGGYATSGGRRFTRDEMNER